jgi:hypothetical protein
MPRSAATFCCDALSGISNSRKRVNDARSSLAQETPARVYPRTACWARTFQRWGARSTPIHRVHR